MPLRIEVDGKPYDPERHDTDRATRRVWCDGCGTGNTYLPHQWVYGPEQVQSWVEEHKSHKVGK